MSRRGRGEGSVYRRKDGLWCATATIGYDELGRRRRRTYYAETKNEVLKKLARAQQSMVAGASIEPQRETVASYMNRWLKDVAKPSVRDSSFVRYEKLVKLHLLPAVGGIPLAKFQPSQLQAVYSKMEARGLSGRTRQFLHAVGRRAFQQAMRWDLIARNVFDLVDRPRVEKKAMQVWTDEQARRFLDAATGDRFQAAYVLALTTGMREGEILGLQWGDVDLAAGTLSVQRAVQEVRSRVVVGEPKSKKSRRLIALPELATAALKDQRERLLALGQTASAWVFPNADGKASRPSVLAQRSFKRITKNAELPAIRFHDLRHTAATLLFAQGVHPKIVQERLGHSSISLTLDTYSHVLPSMQLEAAAKMDAVFADVKRPDWMRDGLERARRERARKKKAKVSKLR